MGLRVTDQLMMQGHQNIAAAIALAVTDDHAAGRVYNLGELKTPTLVERIQRLGTLVNWAGETVNCAK